MATKPSGRPDSEQRRDNADQAEGQDRDDHEEALEALQVEHQQREHNEQHQRHHGKHRRARLRALLGDTADHDVIALGQAGVQLGDRRGSSSETTRLRQDAGRHIGAAP